ncbi:glutamine amidotransferase [Propioniciclava coleopterorum]|uniref:Glutamine amidotransferase n=1 Tax=Propioniciclava coleopterorum TaxID=2714937 RepID=A0A6G7Y3H7_9ACTN|nr:glutamine amidotransferase [Propioniciclava coleopterorum]QIK71362.1 glutamine amidotransferase [Propioniciclava coleopterorum]
MKPFLHLSIRDHDGAAAAELDALRLLGGLGPSELVQARVEQVRLPRLRPDDYAGLIIGGGQFNTSDELKTDVQKRVEEDLGHVVDVAIDHGVPLLGLCYGLGVVTTHLGGVVDRTYGEGAGAVEVTLTEAGLADPLFEGLPPIFRAFTGHKEACSELPAAGVLLASGQACPVQAFRVGERAYVTQFHPELDAERLIARMAIYAHAGYFHPDEYGQLCADARAADVGSLPGRMIGNFVELFRS